MMRQAEVKKAWEMSVLLDPFPPGHSFVAMKTVVLITVKLSNVGFNS